MLKIGLNPYGLAYYLGFQGRGTPRINPERRDLEDFIVLAQELDSRTLEIAEAWLSPLDEAGLQALRDRLKLLNMTPIVSSRLQGGTLRSACTPRSRWAPV